MSWNGREWFAAVVVILPAFCGCYGASAPCEDLAYRVMGALDGTLRFFAREYKLVNLDAVVGIRMAQSQLKVALAELDLDQSSALGSFQDGLEKLSDQAESICDRAIPVVKRHYPKDYRDLGKLVSGSFWSSESSVTKRQTVPSLGSRSRQVTASEPLSEPLTDRCIGQLLGTESKPCRISSFCWFAMTPRGYRSYSLSHQVLYLTIGSAMGCESHFMKRMHRPELGGKGESLLDSLMDGFCSDVLAEAEATARQGFPAGSQDLFMEQVLLCGLKGYEDFFQLPWLQAVLDWQDDSGCFTGDVYRPHGATEDHVVSENSPGTSHIRERRREKEIAGTGCLMHKTSLGAGFLSIYLRMLLETMATGRTSTDCL